MMRTIEERGARSTMSFALCVAGFCNMVHEKRYLSVRGMKTIFRGV